MFFHKNTFMNKLSTFTLAALLALGPAACGGGDSTTGAPPATMPGQPQLPRIERETATVLPHRYGAGNVESLAWEDVSIPTRAGVRQRFLLTKGANAGSRAVILFAGGNGTPITTPQGWGIRLRGNFLVRSSALFAEAGFITAVVDLPWDRTQGRNHSFRQSGAHHSDVRAVVDFLADDGVREVFLIGTSRGTLSVSFLASVMTHPRVAGYVLTGSRRDIVSYAGEIRGPVLMVHHTNDGCFATQFSDAQNTFNAITNSPRKEFVSVSGGDPPRSRACGALSPHGFLGMERETVGAIVKWLNGETPPAQVNP